MGSIRLELGMPESFVLGEVPVAAVRVANGGHDSVDVNARLNMFEGDLRVVVRDRAGRELLVTGPYSHDSEARRVELPPGSWLEAGINLHFTSAGLTFSRAGGYELRVEYYASVTSRVASDPVAVQVFDAVGEEERARLLVTSDEAVGQSLATGEAFAPEGLATLAAGPPGREAFMARLCLSREDPAAAADGAAAVLGEHGPLPVSLWTTAMVPPGLMTRDPRLAGMATVLASLDDDGRATAVLGGRPWHGAPPAGVV